MSKYVAIAYAFIVPVSVALLLPDAVRVGLEANDRLKCTEIALAAYYDGFDYTEEYNNCLGQ